MKMYKFDRRTIARHRKIWLVVATIAAIVLVASIWRLRTDYEHNLQPLSSTTMPTKYFTVASGASLDQIAHNLQNAGLIRNWGAFEWYVRSNELRGDLQAGTYSLSPSMSVSTIAKDIADGVITKNLLTIIPGTRLDQVEQVFEKAGYSKSEATAAMNRSNYIGNAALNNLPAGRSLEGYLFPDSFQKGPTTPATTIVRESLDELNSNLTPQILSGFKTQGLSVYQGITLASIVEQESGSDSDDPTIAQVFLLRLADGMPLGSDVTAEYASAITGVPFDPSIKSPYNTRIVGGLPPGPIGSVSAAALNAVAHPASSTYLYFVTGDNGKTYFSYTEAQHEAFVQQYCVKACN